MDLKDVIEKVNEQAMEAHNAFHAGQHDVAEVHLGRIWWLIEDELPKTGRPQSDVTESITSEKPAALPEEKPEELLGDAVNPAAYSRELADQKPAEVPVAPAQPAVVDPAAAAQQIGTGQAEQKPTQ